MGDRFRDRYPGSGRAAYIGATRRKAPEATICFDASRVIKWTNDTLDAVFRASAIPTLEAQMVQARNNAPWRRARYALRAGRENLKKEQHQILELIRAERVEVHQAYLLKEELRDLFQIIDLENAHAYLTDWIRRAAAGPMVGLARKVHRHFDGIVAAVELGLSKDWASHCTGLSTL